MRMFPIISSAIAVATLLLLPWPSMAKDETESAEEQKQRQAIERFQLVLEKNPKDGTALERVYAWHIDHGTLTDFCQQLKNRQLEKADGQAALLLGLMQARRGQETEAVSSLSAAEQLLPTNAMPSYYLGKCLILQGDIAAGTNAYQRAVDKKPGKNESLEILKELGRCYQRARRTQEALDVWKQMEALFPDDLQVQEQIATVMADEGADAEALPRYLALEEATKDRFRQVEFGMRAASLRLKLGKVDEALAHFERLLQKVNPDSWLYQEIRQRIDQHYLAQRDTKGLITYYEQWIGKRPQDLDAMLRIGRLLSLQSKTAEACTWFEKAIAAAPSQAEGYIELSLALERDGQYAKAAEAMEKLCAKVPGNVDYLVRWGELVLADNGQSPSERQKKAAEIWRTLLTNHEQDQVMVARVAELLRRAHQDEEAIALLRRAILLDPNQLQYHEYLGEYLFKLKRANEALQVWSEMASGPRETIDNLFRLSEVLAQFGFHTRSLDRMGQACQMRPTLSQRLRYVDKLVLAERFDEALKQIELASQQTTQEEEKFLVLEREIQCYVASSRLAKKLQEQEAIVTANEKNSDIDAWLRYAMYLDAGGQPQLAALALKRVVGNGSPSIQILTRASEVYERAGQYDKAIETLNQLLAVDRRQQVSLLMQISKLQNRIGKRQAALETARDLMAVPGAGIEHVSYFADLCFEQGKTIEGLTALRKALRANPDDRQVMLQLARKLGELYETDEAVELVWRALVRASSAEDRRKDVETLVGFYQRLGSVKKLISRLDEYGRQNNRMREADLLKVHAWRTTGDYGLARQIVEKLKDANPDAEMLSTLVSLAQSDNDFHAAARYQAELNKITPSLDGRLQLAKYMLADDDSQSMDSIWSMLKDSQLSLDQLRETLQLLLGRNETPKIVELSDKVLTSTPNDWEKLSLCALALVLANNDSQLIKLCDRLLELQVPRETQSQSFNSAIPSAIATSQQYTLVSSSLPGGIQILTSNAAMENSWQDHILANSPAGSRSREACMARALELHSALGISKQNSALGAQSTQLSTLVGRVATFEDARSLALLLGRDARQSLLKGDDQKDNRYKIVDETKIANETNIDLLWQTFLFSSPSVSINQAPAIVRNAQGVMTLVQPALNATDGPAAEYLRTARQHTLERLVELKQPGAQFLLLIGDVLGGINVTNVQTIHLGRMTETFAQAGEMVSTPGLASLVINHGNSLLKLHADETKEHARVDATITLIAKKFPDYGVANTLVASHPDLACETLVEASRRNLQVAARSASPLVQYQAFSGQTTNFVRSLVAAKDSKVFPQRVNKLIKELKEVQADHARSLRSAQLTLCEPSGQPSASSPAQSRAESSHLIFPPPSPFLSPDLIATLDCLQLNLGSKLSAEVEAELAKDADAQDSDAYQKSVDLLTLVAWNWWYGDRKHEQKATELLDQLKTVCPSPELAILLHYSLLIAQGKHGEALAQLESIKTTDTRLAIMREQAMFELFLRMGATEKARAAANRLLQMPIPARRQLELLSFLHPVGLDAQARSMLNQIRTNNSSSLATQAELLRQFSRDRNDQAALEVAREIMRQTRSSANSQVFSSIFGALMASRPSAGGGENLLSIRKQALRVLAESAQLGQEINELKARLELSPKSRTLMLELAELYEASGRMPEALALAEQARPKQTPRSNARSLPNTSLPLPQEQIKRELDKFAADALYMETNLSSFLLGVERRQQWNLLTSQLMALDYSLFPSMSNSLRKLLERAVPNLNASATNAILQKLVDAKRIEQIGPLVRMVDPKRPALSSEVAQGCLLGIMNALPNTKLNELFPHQLQSDGTMLGPLGVIRRLIDQDADTDLILNKIEPLAQGRDDLQCLHVLMLLEVGQSRDADKLIDQLARKPDIDKQWLWELATELIGEYRRYNTATKLLQQLAETEKDPLQLQVGSAKLLLLTCFERAHDSMGMRALLDEAVVHELNQLDRGFLTRGVLGNHRDTTLFQLAAKYRASGWKWDALVIGAKAEAIQRQSAFKSGGQGQPALQTSQAIQDSSITITDLADGLAREADPKNRLAPLSIPIEMLTPNLVADDAVTDTLHSSLTEQFWWFKQNPKAKELCQPIFEQAVTNRAQLSCTSLIALACTAANFDEREVTLTLAEQLRTRLLEAAAGKLPAELAGDRLLVPGSYENSQLHLALWIVAHRLIGLDELNQTEYFLELANASKDSSLHGVHAQLCVAAELIKRDEKAMASSVLIDALAKLAWSPNSRGNIKQLLLTLEVAKMACTASDTDLSVDAFTQAFNNPATQQIYFGRPRRPATPNVLSPFGPSDVEKEVAKNERLLLSELFELIQCWSQQSADPNIVVKTLEKCVFPDGTDEIRFYSDNPEQTELPDLSMRMRASAQGAGPTLTYSTKVAEAIQKFKEPTPMRALAFTLMDWSQRSGQLKSIIRQLDLRLQNQFRPDGQALLIYAYRVDGDIDSAARELDKLLVGQWDLTRYVPMILHATLSPIDSEKDTNFPGSVVDKLIRHVMDLDLAATAPYCQRRILQSIQQDDLGPYIELTNLFAQACRQFSQGGRASQHEYLFLNEVVSKCFREKRGYMALGALARLQELSRLDKGDARRRHASRAKDALLELAQLPTEKRIEFARQLLYSQFRLNVEAFCIQHVPEGHTPSWFIKADKQDQLKELRPYPASRTISLLDLVLNDAQQKDQLDQECQRLLAIMDEPGHWRTSSDSLLQITVQNAVPGKPTKTSEVDLLTQSCRRALCQWLRLRSHERGQSLPTAIETEQQRVDAQVDLFPWILSLPEAAQYELFDFASRQRELSAESQGKLIETQVTQSDLWRESMLSYVRQQQVSQARFEPTGALKYWFQTDSFSTNSFDQSTDADSTWLIADNHQLRAPLAGRWLAFNIPLGDMSISYDALISKPHPNNSFGGIICGMGLEYRDRGNLAVRDAPLRLTTWLGGGRSAELLLRECPKPDENNRSRRIKLERTGGVNRLSIDDQVVAHGQAVGNGLPLVGLAPTGPNVTISDVEISGTPLSEVPLLDEHLTGWSAQRYQFRLPIVSDLMQASEVELAHPTIKAAESQWHLQDGELRLNVGAESVNATTDPLQATHCYLSYARPLQPGDRIEYEVFVEEMAALPMPCIGYQALMVDNEQVHSHWLPTPLDLQLQRVALDNQAQAPGSEQLAPARLIVNQWNKIALRVDDQLVTLSMNGVDVYRQPFSSVANYEFGWYCHPTDSRVRIRNAVLKGNWPQRLPEDIWAKR